MPSVQIYDFPDISVKVTPKQLAVICKNNKYIWWDPKDAVFILDVEKKTAEKISLTDTCVKSASRLVEGAVYGNKAYMKTFYVPSSGTLRIREIEIDLENKTASLGDYIDVNDSDFDEDNKAQGLRKLIIFASPHKPYIWFIDPDTGEFDKFDTGFGEYNPRISLKGLLTKDDLKLIIGRHLAGDKWYILSVYHREVTALQSINSDSPIHTLLPAVYFYDDIYFFCSGSNVVNSSPNWYIFDKNFNKLAEISFTDIYSNPHYYGFECLGRNGDHIYLFGIITNNHLEYATEEKLVMVDIDRSTWSKSVTTLLTISDMSNGLEISTNDCHADVRWLGFVDKKNKKLYLPAGRYDKSQLWDYKCPALVEIDYSDLEIEEYNQNLYFKGEEKIPTTLSLTITPL